MPNSTNSRVPPEVVAQREQAMRQNYGDLLDAARRQLVRGFKDGDPVSEVVLPRYQGARELSEAIVRRAAEPDLINYIARLHWRFFGVTVTWR